MILVEAFQKRSCKYRETRRVINDTGGGLSEEELLLGMSSENKLNGMCEHFHKMDEQMGSRVNIQPPAMGGPMGFHRFAKASWDSLSSPPIEVVDVSSPSPVHNETGGEENSPPWMGEPLLEYVDELVIEE